MKQKVSLLSHSTLLIWTDNMKQEYDELMKEIKKKIEEKNEIETKLKELTEVAGYSVDAIIKMCKEGYTFIPPKRKGY